MVNNSFAYSPGIYGDWGNWYPRQQQVQPEVQQQPTSPNTGMYGDPFSTAMSGNQKFSLQPYVNRMTQNASNALYGGLLGYRPQSMIAGNAGGTPVNSTVPNWRLPSAIPTPNQGQVGLLGAQANPQQQMGIFGNRPWMVA